MSDKDVLAFGSARAYKLAEEDENARLMYQLSHKDGPTPFCLPGQCPLDAIEGVARGLAEGTVKFFFHKHLIKIGDLEWSLDSDLTLWREARTYAASLSSQGLLSPALRLFTPSWAPYGCEYRRA